MFHHCRADRVHAGFAGVLAATVIALGFASLGPLAPWIRPASAQSPVAVVNFTPEDRDLSGPLFFVRGLLTNHGAGPVQDVQVHLVIRDAPGGRTLAEGNGFGLLGVMGAGETGPFTAGMRFCCARDVGAYEWTVYSKDAPADRYRSFAVEHVVTRTVASEHGPDPVIMGDLVNTGDAYMNLSDTRLDIAFWSGDRMVELNPVRFPLVFTFGGVGQSHPPGFRYPWALSLPAKAYDRVEFWPQSTPFPAGSYPVPIGVRGAQATLDGSDIVVTAQLFNCGQVPAEDIVVVLDGRDEDDRPLAFAAGQLALNGPLQPGYEGPITVRWSNPSAPVDPARVRMVAMAQTTQSQRPDVVPARWPCPNKRRWVWLPALLLGQP